MNGVLQSLSFKVEDLEDLLLRVVNDDFLSVNQGKLDLPERLKLEDVNKSLISDVPLSENPSGADGHQLLLSLPHRDDLCLVDIPVSGLCLVSRERGLLSFGPEGAYQEVSRQGVEVDQVSQGHIDRVCLLIHNWCH